MEQIIKIFENEKFGRIRTITKDGEPWFVIADVCRALEIRNSRMVAGRLDRDMRLLSEVISRKHNLFVNG